MSSALLHAGEAGQRHHDEVFWWKGNNTPPKDMQKWNGLIKALIEHWRQRYGDAEIAQWYYEVWNEPDLSYLAIR